MNAGEAFLRQSGQEVRMRKTAVLGAVASAAAIAALGAGSAFAGEIKGPGSPTGVPVDEAVATAAPAHTNSICAYSGLNHFHEGEFGELPIRTQSYGQLVRYGYKSMIPSPGVACNGHTGFLAGG
jgi:hypothetical protein